MYNFLLYFLKLTKTKNLVDTVIRMEFQFLEVLLNTYYDHIIINLVLCIN